MSRTFLFILDSVGIGGAPDADRFGDRGANTLGHIAAHVPLSLPHLASLGLGHAALAASGHLPKGFTAETALKGQWGFGVEKSNGKDTPSGHWEIAGVPVSFDWGYFPKTVPCFPKSFTDALIAQAELPGLLGNKHASGTDIIAEFGEDHMESSRPIIYTSADSVIQIAAHEETFGLDRLYEVCQVARELSYDLNVGRVIARPFVGADAGDFTRTGNRKDYSISPPAPTLLDRLTEVGREVISIGKIGDIYAHSGTGREIKAVGNEALFEASLAALPGLAEGGLLITNFVDFDMLYGHRRDPRGYGAALEAFDALLPEALALLKSGDLLVITADHGCDPTWRGSDHTRECVPILTFSPGAAPASFGRRDGFADIGQTIAAHLGIAPLGAGKSWL
ncbi:phosphopentomutase [Taklimakanibacter albus]|uniref:Phosphopentomutase n=1 Tax=Taklimakanibacter albus TaxID=2800327 RepID=A0ACC5REE7_9HYPH|nr:phosphopentomutase [Aestuariivirga sp. YIM B02566]MBK1871076.1 phosphopentomutase [Aestuariivirga sp. YIM B02566]